MNESEMASLILKGNGSWHQKFEKNMNYQCLVICSNMIS